MLFRPPLKSFKTEPLPDIPPDITKEMFPGLVSPSSAPIYINTIVLSAG